MAPSSPSGRRRAAILPDRRRYRASIPRRTATLLLAATVGVAGACSDDGRSGPVTTTTASPAGSSTVVFDDFAAEDAEALCADLAGLADIDPAADPTQPQVDRLLTIARTAPSGVAEPLRAVAAFGQAVVDDADDVEAHHDAAVEAAVLLIAYGNEACRIDVPLFDSIAGV